MSWVQVKEVLGSKAGLVALGALVGIIAGVKYFRPFSAAVPKLSADELKKRLLNKNILIVGGTAGIGRALAMSCLERDAKVTVVGRRQPDSSLAKATFAQADLTSMHSAEALVDKIDLAAFDIVVFTVGIMPSPERKATPEGVELDMGISFLSRLAMASQFKRKNFGSNRSDKSVKSRIFVMGFPGVYNTMDVEDFNSEKSYGAISAHMNTVIANEALVPYLTNELGDTTNVYGLNPGLLYTEIRDQFLGRDSWKSYIVESIIALCCKSPQQYSERTLVHAMVSPDLEDKPSALIDCDRTYLTPNTWLTVDDHQAKVMAAANALLDRALKSA